MTFWHLLLNDSSQPKVFNKVFATFKLHEKWTWTTFEKPGVGGDLYQNKTQTQRYFCHKPKEHSIELSRRFIYKVKYFTINSSLESSKAKRNTYTLKVHKKLLQAFSVTSTATATVII